MAKSKKQLAEKAAAERAEAALRRELRKIPKAQLINLLLDPGESLSIYTYGERRFGVNTAGCGCCSDTENFATAAEAVARLMHG